jgi:enediyne biosynthesis protein E9
LVIGSGFGAAAPAWRLAQAGFRVVMVEKGPAIDPLTDFRQTSDPQYLLRFLKGIAADHLAVTYAEAMGGGSGFYEMVSLRAPSLAFLQADSAGRSLWPRGLDRTALDPWYDLAEEMLQVRQIPAEEVPKTGQVFALMMRNLGYSCDRARYAEKGCIGSGFCVTGCIYAAKQSLLLNYLPRAKAAGVIIETGLDARRIFPLGRAHETARGGRLPEIPYRYGVWCRRAETGEAVQFRSRLLVVAGGTIGTAALLLRLRSKLPRLGPHVGRNVAFNGSVKAAGLLPEGFPDGDMFTGRTHPGMISYHFLESHGVTVSAAKAMPLQLAAGTRLHLDGDTRGPAWWGAANVELMKLYRRRVIALYTMGLTPPVASVQIDRTGEPRLQLLPDDSLVAYHERTLRLLHGILRDSGCRHVELQFLDRTGGTREELFFSTAHQVGSCRMADSSRDGVVDGSGEAFDYPGLYLSDGSVIPTSLGVNTSLTILANAERVAAAIRDRYTAV